MSWIGFDFLNKYLNLGYLISASGWSSESASLHSL